MTRRKRKNPEFAATKTVPVVKGYVRCKAKFADEVFGPYQNRYANPGETYWVPYAGGAAVWVGEEPPPDAEIVTRGER